MVIYSLSTNMEDDQSNTTELSEQNADDTASSTTTFKGFSPQRAIADAIATGWGQTAAEADYGHTDLPWDVDDDVASDTDMATQEKRKATAMHTDDDEVDQRGPVPQAPPQYDQRGGYDVITKDKRPYVNSHQVGTDMRRVETDLRKARGDIDNLKETCRVLKEDNKTLKATVATLITVA